MLLGLARFWRDSVPETHNHSVETLRPFVAVDNIGNEDHVRGPDDERPILFNSSLVQGAGTSCLLTMTNISRFDRFHFGDQTQPRFLFVEPKGYVVTDTNLGAILLDPRDRGDFHRLYHKILLAGWGVSKMHTGPGAGESLAE